MESLKLTKIKETLKSLLKKQNYSYQDLANHLNCSLPTIKRCLGNEELSTTRLLQICQFLDVTLSDIETIIDRNSKEQTPFTREQESYLVKNKEHLSYLMCLYSGMSPEEVKEKYNLTQLSQDKYLLGLEKMDLIKVSNSGKIKTTFDTVPAWGNGILARTYFENMIDANMSFFKSRIKKKIESAQRGETSPDALPEGISTIEVPLTKESYLEWVAEQRRSIKELEKTALIEGKTYDKKDMKVAVVFTAHSYIENDSQDLLVLENIFGKVKNLP